MPPVKKGGTPPTKPPTTAKTKTGGGGDGGDGGSLGVVGIPTVVEGDEQPVLKRRIDLLLGQLTESRLPEEYEFSLNPASLVGSWFHRLENDEIVWQGVVVAIGGTTPEGPVYLCQIEKLDVGAEDVQRLIPLSRMVTDEEGYDWRFYDSRDVARKAYAQWIATRKERT